MFCGGQLLLCWVHFWRYTGPRAGPVQYSYTGHPSVFRVSFSTQGFLLFTGFPSLYRVSFSLQGFFLFTRFPFSTGFPFLTRFPSLYRVSFSLQGLPFSTGFPSIYRVSFSLKGFLLFKRFPSLFWVSFTLQGFLLFTGFPFFPFVYRSSYYLGFSVLYRVLQVILFTIHFTPQLLDFREIDAFYKY